MREEVVARFDAKSLVGYGFDWMRLKCDVLFLDCCISPCAVSGLGLCVCNDLLGVR